MVPSWCVRRRNKKPKSFYSHFIYTLFHPFSGIPFSLSSTIAHPHFLLSFFYVIFYFHPPALTLHACKTQPTKNMWTRVLRMKTTGRKKNCINKRKITLVGYYVVIFFLFFFFFLLPLSKLFLSSENVMGIRNFPHYYTVC